MGSPQQHHHDLAGISPAQLIEGPVRTARPMGVHELAEVVDLHPNTSRQHLGG
jgi:predicted ArsR family transcriptional regulator